jgi:hypothetical protein
MSKFEQMIHRYIKDGNDFQQLEDFEVNLDFYRKAMEHNMTHILTVGIEKMKMFNEIEEYENTQDTYDLMKMAYDIYLDVYEPLPFSQIMKDMAYKVLINKLLYMENEY